MPSASEMERVEQEGREERLTIPRDAPVIVTIQRGLFRATIEIDALAFEHHIDGVQLIAEPVAAFFMHMAEHLDG